MSDIIQINAAEAAKCITTCWLNKLVPMLHGSPGIGKSHIVQALAKKHKLKLIDVRLSQCDALDLNGFPMVANGKGTYVPMDMFPLEDDTIPDGYVGWLLFFDEINSPAQSVQAAAYKIILDKMVGQKKLHSKVFMAAAGNLMTDMAITNRLSTAMQSRLIHFELAVEHKVWAVWAAQNNINQRIIGYINSNPPMLHQFNPNHHDKTFPCPRTWEAGSKVITNNKYPELVLPLLAGAVGKAGAIGYITYEEVYNEICTFEDILKSPTGINLPRDPAAIAACATMVGANMTLANAKALMPWVLRLGIEFQAFCMRDAVNRTPLLLQSQEVDDWLNANAKVLA